LGKRRNSIIEKKRPLRSRVREIVDEPLLAGPHTHITAAAAAAFQIAFECRIEREMGGKKD
jgi:glycine/serine hydroxymethyltransferase